MDITTIAAVGIAGLIAGYGIFRAILSILPKRLQSENIAQAAEVIAEAKKQQNAIKEDALTQEAEELEILREDLTAEIEQSAEELKEISNNLDEQEKLLVTQESRVQSIGDRYKNREKKLEALKGDYQNLKSQLNETRKSYLAKLEVKTSSDITSIRARISNSIWEARQLECQKVMKSLEGELSSSAKRMAQRVLDRVNSRYAPNFIWPKPSNIIEVTNPEVFEYLSQEDNPFIAQLKELSGADAQVLGALEGNNTPILKFGGGFGIYREAARLTASELIHQPRSQWKKAKTIYASHQAELENQAVVLGKRAVNELRLKNIHPEIQKLVGALNWRTSYRQNQWYHTVEVAVLAGIIASELGVDPEEAKRVGMLHDIGKAIDYRIEGSHAVISGDYADRYGENRKICDTVMSHHADLRVETPLAYVLRAADTLSGARPGARVNLEEGYQIRLTAISDAVWSFKGVSDLAIMNGGREIHVQVNYKKVKEGEVSDLASSIARKIEQEVAFPGQIKVLVSRSFESVSVA